MEVMLPISEIKEVHFHEDDRKIDIINRDEIHFTQNMLYQGTIFDFIRLADKTELLLNTFNFKFIYTKE